MRGRLASPRIQLALAAILLLPAVSAGTPGPWAVWVTETVDDRRHALSPAVAIAQEGQIHLSYAADVAMDEPNALHHATRDLGLWTKTRISLPEQWGLQPSMAIDSLGHPHIIYWVPGPSDLWYARWDGTEWNREQVSSSGLRGSLARLVLDASDQPHILDLERATTNVLHYITRGPSGWVSTPLYSNVGTGDADLAIDASGKLHATFNEATSTYSIVYATLPPGGTWSFEKFFGADHTLALTPTGQPHIAYRPNSATVLWHATKTPQGWAFTPVQTKIRAIGSISIDTDSAGKPHISYQQSSNPANFDDPTHGHLWYATQLPDGTWWNELVEPRGHSWENRIAVGPDDIPRIVYSWFKDHAVTVGSQDLKFAEPVPGKLAMLPLR